MQISDFPLTSLSTQEQGKIMAVGSGNGGLSIIQISESLSSASRNDRTSLTSVRLPHSLQESSRIRMNLKQLNTKHEDYSIGSHKNLLSSWRIWMLYGPISYKIWSLKDKDKNRMSNIDKQINFQLLIF